jgi:anti-sigma factor RsiW
LVTCKDFIKELSEYLDDATDPTTRAELEQHLSQCPNCWVVCDTTKKTIKVFKGMDLKDLPAEVHTRLISAVEKKAASKAAPKSSGD